MLQLTRKSRSGEEDDVFPSLPHLGHGLVVELGPQTWPLVVQQGGWLAAVQRGVHREVLAKVRHPPSQAQLQHVALDHVC